MTRRRWKPSATNGRRAAPSGAVVATGVATGVVTGDRRFGMCGRLSTYRFGA